jgi:hypothetical protein
MLAAPAIADLAGEAAHCSPSIYQTQINPSYFKASAENGEFLFVACIISESLCDLNIQRKLSHPISTTFLKSVDGGTASFADSDYGTTPNNPHANANTLSFTSTTELHTCRYYLSTYAEFSIS